MRCRTDAELRCWLDDLDQEMRRVQSEIDRRYEERVNYNRQVQIAMGMSAREPEHLRRLTTLELDALKEWTR